jgi:hypothetical protein
MFEPAELLMYVKCLCKILCPYLEMHFLCFIDFDGFLAVADSIPTALVVPGKKNSPSYAKTFLFLRCYLMT